MIAIADQLRNTTGVSIITLTSLFNLYIDKIIQNWQMYLPDHFMIGYSVIDTAVYGRPDYSVSLRKQVADGYIFVKLNLQSFWITNIHTEDQSNGFLWN